MNKTASIRTLINGVASEFLSYRVAIDSVDFGGDADLVFNGFGVPDSSGFVQVVVGTELRRVDVDVSSGKATIQ